MNKNTRNSWKVRVESGFEALGLMMGRHPWLWLLGCVLVVGALSSQLGRLEKDTSIEGFLEKGSTEIQRYDAFKETFGRDEIFIITLEVETPFTQAFATQFHALHRQLEDEVPYVDKVESLANARYTYGEDDTLYIEPLLPEVLPEDPVALEQLKRYTLQNENYRNFLISGDGRMLAILVRLSSFTYTQDANGDWQRGYMGEDETRQADARIREILKPYRGVLSDDIRLTGSMPIAITLSHILERDFTVFSALANLLIGALLLVIFRRLPDETPDRICCAAANWDVFVRPVAAATPFEANRFVARLTHAARLPALVGCPAISRMLC